MFPSPGHEIDSSTQLHFDLPINIAQSPIDFLFCFNGGSSSEFFIASCPNALSSTTHPHLKGFLSPLRRASPRTGHELVSVRHLAGPFFPQGLDLDFEDVRDDDDPALDMFGVGKQKYRIVSGSEAGTGVGIMLRSRGCGVGFEAPSACLRK